MKKESQKYSHYNKSHKRFKDSQYPMAPTAFCRSSRRYKWPLAMNERDSVFFPFILFFSHEYNTFVVQQQCVFLMNPNRDFSLKVMPSIFLSDTY